MEADKLNKGHIIYADGSALKTVDTTTGNITLITGEATNHGFEDSSNIQKAFFHHITGFVQAKISDRYTVLVVVARNNCIRYIHRKKNNTVATFAGRCGTVGGFSDNADMRYAMFNSPQNIIIDRLNPKRFIVTDRDNNALRSITLNGKFIRGSVATLVKSDELLYKPQGIIQDRRSGDFIVSIAHAIVRVPESYSKSHHLTVLAGSSVGGGWNLKIGKVLEKSSLIYPGDMMSLNKVGVSPLLIAGKNLHLMREKRFVTLCDGKGESKRVMWSSECNITNPISLLALKGSLYIGQDGQIIAVMKGKIDCC